MYIFDTNIFITLGYYYPKQFPSIWRHLDGLVSTNKVNSVREVFRELEVKVAGHVGEWVVGNGHIFKKPTENELKFVAEIFKIPHFFALVKRENLLKGMPVADPFIIAAAKINSASVVTNETFVPNGARIPNVCEKFKIPYLNLEKFFENEGIKY